MYWIINNNIEFKPNLKKLISATNPELEIVLTTPASRCLELLLESYPDVVTQQDLFSNVWEGEGMLVPANTLYQNISIIRRGLRIVGQTDDILITTVPRKGFKIDKAITILKCENGNYAMTGNAGSVELTPIDDNCEVETDFHPQTKLEHTIEMTSPAWEMTENKPLAQGNFHMMTLFLSLFAFLFGVVAVNSAWHLSHNKPFFSDYTFIQTEQGCHFYIKDNAHHNGNYYNKIKTAVLNSGLSCNKYPWIYFPVSDTFPSSIVFACQDKYMTTARVNCITLSFRGVINE